MGSVAARRYDPDRGSATTIHAQKTVLRIDYPERVKAAPDTQLENEGRPKNGQGSAIIKVRELGLHKSMAAKHALESASGIHPIDDRKSVSLLRLPEQPLGKMMKAEGHEIRDDRDGRPSVNSVDDDVAPRCR